jgi:hypothetical protein
LHDLILRALTDHRFFPTVLAVLDVAAAARYALCGADEWRKVVYWLAAAALTAVVTW